MFTKKLEKIFSIVLLVSLSFGISNAATTFTSADFDYVKNHINNMRNSSYDSGILGGIFERVFDDEGKIRDAFYNFVNTATDGYIPLWEDAKFVDSPIYSTGGQVGIGTTTLSEKVTIDGGLSLTKDPDSGDDVGDRAYNDARYINVGESGDSILDGTIDSSEIEDNTLTSSDLALDSVGASELANNSVASANIIDNTITESDIIDTFKARDSDELDGLDSLAFQKRVAGICPAGESIRVINEDGTVVCEVDDSAALTVGANYLAKSDGSGLVNSSVYETLTGVGIGTTTPSVDFEVAGDVRVNTLGTTCVGNCGTSLPALTTSDSTVTGNLNVSGDITSTTGDLSITGSGTIGNGLDVTGITNINGDTTINGEFDVSSGHIIRKSVVQVNTANHSTTTAWKLGPSFSTIPDFKAGSKVKLSYHMPMRNDTTGRGGGYIEPQISFDGGTTRESLGSSGYDGVMNNGHQAIGSYYNTILVDPAQASDYSVTVRFYFRAYSATVMINQSHSINTVSGTATLMSGVNGTQHYAKVIVEELY